VGAPGGDRDGLRRLCPPRPEQFLLIFDRLPSGRSSLQQQPGPRSPYRILLDGVQAALDSGAIRVREGYGLEEIAYGIWALVHGLAAP
jgi:hypothetical protein